MELVVFPVLSIVFVLIFVREVIAPASRNHCDRRWLILATSMGVATVLSTLAAGYWLAAPIRRYALWHAHDHLPVGLGSVDVCSRDAFQAERRLARRAVKLRLVAFASRATRSSVCSAWNPKGMGLKLRRALLQPAYSDYTVARAVV